jgi:hypothetical protein
MIYWLAIGFVIGLLAGVGLAWPYAWREGRNAR